uniref:General transcription factor IIF subunit 2 n=1 Tax=Hucho hucho TaxID=62062 RepID=A0A4W5KMF0_9TELE
MSEKGEVDLTGAKQNTGVWLVKVPKYLSQQWAKAAGRGEVGKLRIAKNQGKAEVAFTLNEDLTMIDSLGDKPSGVQAPRDHPFTMQTVGGQTLAYCVSLRLSPSQSLSPSPSLSLSTPLTSSLHLSHSLSPSLSLSLSSSSPHSLSISLSMPLSLPLSICLSLCCGLHSYLKEILRDIGIYNVKGTHKNTWELRPEYRHYQGGEEEEKEIDD